MEIVQFFANGFLNTVLLSLYRSSYPSIPFGSISRLAVKYNGQEVRSAPSTSPHNQQATKAPLLLIRLGSMRCLIDSFLAINCLDRSLPQIIGRGTYCKGLLGYSYTFLSIFFPQFLVLIEPHSFNSN